MDEQFLGGKFEKELSFFKQDVQTVRKLLYRNASQHKSTLAFSYLQRISRLLQMWKIDQLLLIRDIILKLHPVQIQQVKLTQSLVDQHLVLAHTLHCALQHGTKIVTYINKAFQVFSKQLIKQVFVPLFSFVWAWLAKIFRHVKHIVLPFAEAFQHVTSQLKQISCISKKHSELIDAQFAEHTGKLILPPQSIGVIQLLKVISSNSDMDDGDMDAVEEDDLDITKSKHEKEILSDFEAEDDELGEPLTESTGMTPNVKQQNLIRNLILGAQSNNRNNNNTAAKSIGEDEDEDQGEEVDDRLITLSALTPVAAGKTMKQTVAAGSSSAVKNSKSDNSTNKISIIKVNSSTSFNSVPKEKKPKGSNDVNSSKHTDLGGEKKRKPGAEDGEQKKKKKKVNNNDIDDIFGGL